LICFRGGGGPPQYLIGFSWVVEGLAFCGAFFAEYPGGGRDGKVGVKLKKKRSKKKNGRAFPCR